MAKTLTASQLIDRHIAAYTDWRGETLGQLRALIHAAVPTVVEEWKWGGPVWSSNGLICTGEVYKATVKLTFAHGAALDDPARLFNSSLSGGTRRAIDLREAERVNARAFKALVKAAAKRNAVEAKSAKPKKPTAAKTLTARKTSTAAKSATAQTPAKARVRLLSGDNPQIAKAYGDAPVQEYIAAIPDWRGEAAVKLDALIVRTVPNAQKAVKWNSAFYGKDAGRWFLCFHVFAKYLKVTFFRGTSLTPIPPEPSKTPETRYAHIVDSVFDEALFTKWIKQAAALPGEKL